MTDQLDSRANLNLGIVFQAIFDRNFLVRQIKRSRKTPERNLKKNQDEQVE